MARGRGSSATSNEVANDPLSPLLDPVLPVQPLSPLPLPSELLPLTEIEDLRFWHPDSDPDALLTSGVPTPIVERRSANSARRMTRRAIFLSRPTLAFHNPLNVVTCIRRKARREVLHALKKTRAGRGRGRRRTWRSNIRC